MLINFIKRVWLVVYSEVLHHLFALIWIALILRHESDSVQIFIFLEFRAEARLHEAVHCGHESLAMVSTPVRFFMCKAA